MKQASRDIASIGAILLRRKGSIVLTAVIAGGLGFAGSHVMPRRYSSEGSLVLASDQPNIPELTLATAGGNDQVGAAAQTLIDSLRAPGSAEAVVRQLNLAEAPDLQPVSRMPPLAGLLAPVIPFTPSFVTSGLAALQQMVGRGTAGPAADPQEAAVSYVASHLKVEGKDHSNLLSVQFTAGSPALAAAVVNAAMTIYIDNDIAARRARLAQAGDWLASRAAELRNEVAADDAAIERFLQGHDVATVQGSTVAATQLSTLQSQLASARQELTRLETTRDTAHQQGARGGASAQEVLASPLIQALRQREAALVQQTGGLAALNPDRLRAENELRSVRAQISGETDRIVGSFGRQTDIARANVQTLERAVADAVLAARQSSTSEIYFGQLTRDAEAKRQLYNAFVVRADQTRLATAQFPPAHILFAAVPPRRPDASGALLPVLLGLLGGGFLASAIVVLRDQLRSRISSARDVAMATGLPVFGSLPQLRLRGQGRGVQAQGVLQLRASAHVQSLLDETLRALWLAMRSMTGGDSGTTLVVTSSEAGEGKTTVAAALARRVAADGFRVMLIDADLRRPSLLPGLSLRSTARLEGVLTGAVSLEDAVMTDPASGLHCLLAAGGAANPNRLLASDAFTRLLAALRRSYDLVVLDSPPVLRVADAQLLSRLTDHTLLVIECGRMRGDFVAEAVRRFPKDCRSKMIAILTKVPQDLLDRRDYYAGYGPAPQSSRDGALESEMIRRADGHPGKTDSAAVPVVAGPRGGDATQHSASPA